MSAADSITLRGGCVVPLSALQFCWALEDRGLNLQLDGDDILVHPRTLLTDTDRAAIRELRPYLKALIAYLLGTGGQPVNGRTHRLSVERGPLNGDHEKTWK